MNCNSGNCNIVCSGIRSCRSATMYGKNSNDLVIHCQQSNACESINLHCSESDSNCEIDCNSKEACHYATIYGASGRNLQVDCEQDYACDRVVIDGSKTNSLELLGCRTGIATCRGITVTCPPHDNFGNPQCIINGLCSLYYLCFIKYNFNYTGDEDLFGTINYPLTFYARNGFQDITFQTSSKSDSNYFGTMYCGLNYTLSCNMSTNWICDASGSIKCNDPKTTNAPTVVPTFIPTFDPTFIPTVNPTIDPTFIPTKYPTDAPTINPSYNPVTSIPTTSMPTTSIPTQYPTSLNPTQSPDTVNPTNTPTIVTKKVETPTLHVPISGSPTDTPVSTTVILNTRQQNKSKDDKETEMFKSFTMILIMILSVVILCCCLFICCFKQLKKDRTTQKTYGVNVLSLFLS